MGVLNKRNAFLGWAVWKVGKRLLKRKAKGVVPGRETPSGKGKGKGIRAIVALAAAAGGALFFWRRSRDEPFDSDSESSG